MKAYDLCIIPKSLRDAMEIASLLPLMGIKGVAVEPTGVNVNDLKRIFTSEGLEFYTRVTFEARSGKEVVEKARKLRLDYDLLAVIPRSAEAARVAARDPRIDLVVLPPGMARYMDRSQARLLAEGGGCIELRMSYILEGGDPRRRLRGLLIVARRAAAFEACIVGVSGARSKWELWHPQSIKAFLVAMGLPENIAGLAVTGYPSLVLKRV